MIPLVTQPGGSECEAAWLGPAGGGAAHEAVPTGALIALSLGS